MSSTEPISHQSKWLLYLGLSGQAIFVILVAFLHFIQPDHNPISQALSEYAVGRWGILLSGSLFAMALGSNAIVLLLLQALPRSRPSKAGLGLLALWGVGTFVAGAFLVDTAGDARSLSGTIHAVASVIAFVSVVAGINILSMAGAIPVKSDSYRKISKGLGHATATLFVLLFALIPAGWGGLGQRALVALVLFWFTLTAMHVAGDPAGDR